MPKRARGVRYTKSVKGGYWQDVEKTVKARKLGDLLDTEPDGVTFEPDQVDALKALLALVHRDELAESWWQALPGEVREVLGDA